MNDSILTHFDLDPEKLDTLRVCIDNYDVGASNAGWPNNILSRQTVVYGNGTIARSGEDVTNRVDADELPLCQRFAAEVTKIMDGVEVGMGSESGDTFHSFYVTANVGESVSRPH